jgi:hypothetical protein
MRAVPVVLPFFGAFLEDLSTAVRTENVVAQTEVLVQD